MGRQVESILTNEIDTQQNLYSQYANAYLV
jgi:hypothetical protein